MLIKSRVLADEQRVDKKRRDFAQRNFESVRAGQAAVNFTIDIEYGVALRHFADLFQVEGLGPDAVKYENTQAARRDQPEQREFPAVAEQATAAFFSRTYSDEKFHR